MFAHRRSLTTQSQRSSSCGELSPRVGARLGGLVAPNITSPSSLVRRVSVFASLLSRYVARIEAHLCSQCLRTEVRSCVGLVARCFSRRSCFGHRDCVVTKHFSKHAARFVAPFCSHCLRLEGRCCNRWLSAALQVAQLGAAHFCFCVASFSAHHADCCPLLLR